MLLDIQNMLDIQYLQIQCIVVQNVFVSTEICVLRIKYFLSKESSCTQLAAEASCFVESLKTPKPTSFLLC